jgi:gliding motility-associated-like protein
MRRKLILIVLLFYVAVSDAYANHIAGGELFYEYVGKAISAGTYKFKFTLRLFRECSSEGLHLDDQQVTIGVYDNASLSLYKSAMLSLRGPVKQIAFTPSTLPCLVNTVDVCYQVAEYSDTVEIGSAPFGFTAAWSACCRAGNIANILDTLSGSTYYSRMPGLVHNVYNNNSARFVLKDTVVVCAGKPFSIDFSAFDPDGDTLVYSFDGALNAERFSNGANPPENFYATGLTYKQPFTGSEPIGTATTINTFTGVMSGVAPDSGGNYVLNVSVEEIKGGLQIGRHNKDFLVNVKNCDLIEASFKPSYISCDDFTFDFKNELPNPAIKSYFYDFGVPGGNSTLATPSFTYPDTGKYKVKLVVTGNAGCIDSAETIVNVYPIFAADFTASKVCQDSTVQFTDATLATYGNISSYAWNFGDTLVVSDTSHLPNPGYLYGNTPGPRNVQLVVTSSKGCVDSITKPLIIIDNPINNLSFRDTTICKTDTLAISVNGPGTYEWSPTYNIINASTNNALVYPSTSFTYYVTNTYKDCITKDSVRIKVLDSITVRIANDTTICLTDSIRMQTISEGLAYLWSPVNGLNNAREKSPLITPVTSTTYFVTAALGHCRSIDSIYIQTAPYAIANAGTDTTICFGDQVQLQASVYGDRYTWSNTNSLLNANTLQPIAYPQRSIRYTLTVDGAPGCPRPVKDSIVVTVLAPLSVWAGNDTLIIEGQPLPLRAVASAEATYTWTPVTGLNDREIANPLLMINSPAGPLTYKVDVVTQQGCTASDEIKVTVFKKDADIYVPSAFTPNNDGTNDQIRSIPVGIKTFHFFAVYNRYGQLLFRSSDPQKEWNGKFKGVDQPTGTYIFTTAGIDIHGKLLSKKGTIVLIR